MNRRPDAPDPLSPEERDLAERLLRLGPHEGPSATLDAAILAAARAAVAAEPVPDAASQAAAALAAAPLAATPQAAAPQAAAPQAAAARPAAPQAGAPRARPKKTRWPAWIGVAASLTLAVGVAWQLRPLDKAPSALSEEQAAPTVAAMPPARRAPAADVLAAPQSPEPTPTPMPIQDRAPAPAPVLAKPAPAPARVVSPPVEERALESRAAAGKAVENRSAEKRAAADAAPPAAREFDRRAKSEAPRAAQAQSTQAMPTPADVPPPPAPPPPAPAPAIAPPAAQGYGYSAPADAAPANTTRARRQPAAEGERAAGQVEGLSRREGQRPVAAPPAEAAANAPIAAEAQRSAPPQQNAADATVLDRVQITGSRIAPSQHANALAPEQWLERIRQYRDDGELDLARQDLREFRRAHPRARIPKDLRPLLE